MIIERIFSASIADKLLIKNCEMGRYCVTLKAKFTCARMCMDDLEWLI